MTIQDYWQHIRHHIAPDYSPKEGPPVYSNFMEEAIMAMDELVSRQEGLEF